MCYRFCEYSIAVAKASTTFLLISSINTVSTSIIPINNNKTGIKVREAYLIVKDNQQT